MVTLFESYILIVAIESFSIFTKEIINSTVI